MGHRRKKCVRTVERVNKRRNRKSEPECGGLEKRTDCALGPFGHFYGEGDEWKGTLFIFDPLLSKKHRETYHDKVDDQHVERPHGQRCQPRFPWNRFSGKQTFVKGLDRHFVSDNSPLGDILMKKLFPLILRGCIILVSDHRPERVAHHARRGNARRCNHDTPDRDEFLGR